MPGNEYMQESVSFTSRENVACIQNTLVESLPHLWNELLTYLQLPVSSDKTLPYIQQRVSRLTGYELVVYYYDAPTRCFSLFNTSLETMTLSAPLKRTLPGDSPLWQLVNSSHNVQENNVVLSREAFGLAASNVPVRSYLELPLLSMCQMQEGILLGAAVVLSEQPDALQEPLLSFFFAVCTVAARVLEYTYNKERELRRQEIVKGLNALTQKAGLELSLDTFLTSATDLASKLLQAGQGLLMMLSQKSERSILAVHTRSFVSSDMITGGTLVLRPEEVEELTDIAFGANRQELTDFLFTHSTPLRNTSLTHVIVVPLLSKNRLLGLLCFSFRDKPLLDDEDEQLVSIIANHMNERIINEALSSLLAESRMIKVFFDVLLLSSESDKQAMDVHADVLGLNLRHPHGLALLEIGEERESKITEEADRKREYEIENRWKMLILQHYPGSLLYINQHILTALVDLSSQEHDMQFVEWFREQYLLMIEETHIRTSIGISAPCLTIWEVGRGFDEARQALEVGRSVNPEGGVTPYMEIRLYQYLTSFGYEKPSDPFLEMIHILDHYDQVKKNSHLLETLQAYLKSRGHIQKTAMELSTPSRSIHRTTVEQRLNRINDLTGVDVFDMPLFEVELALRLYKQLPPSR